MHFAVFIIMSKLNRKIIPMFQNDFLDEGCSDYFARKLCANAHGRQIIKYEIMLANLGC